MNLHTGEITTSAPTPEGFPLERSWLFAAQETVALFRPAGADDVALTYIDLALRVLGPLFLALAVLAIRNRTKR